MGEDWPMETPIPVETTLFYLHAAARTVPVPDTHPPRADGGGRAQNTAMAIFGYPGPGYNFPSDRK